MTTAILKGMRLQTIREARWILGILLALAGLSFWIYPWLAVVWLALIAYTFYFFRDPDRVAAKDPDSILAAADGVVVDIIETVEPQVLKKTMHRIGIFLSVFDVHTNRSPIAGKVTFCQHYVGKFLDARHADATTLNECRTWVIEGMTVSVAVRQITGAIARRIVGWAKVGDELEKGERFGMIRFGSRTEVYVPLECTVTVKVGDRVQGGLSVIAKLSHEPVG